MRTLDTKNGTAGGGEILQYIGNNNGSSSQMDEGVLKQFSMLPWVRLIVIALIIVAAFLIIIRMFKVKNPLRGKAITHELDNMDKIRKHDESIVRANRIISAITNLVERTPFALSKSYVEYWNYNLYRANIRIPGKARVMRATEFNALIKATEAFVVLLGLLVTVFFNGPLGLLLIISAIVMCNTFPMMIVRQTVKTKYMEIIENFAQFYLMIHYVLLASSGTPISGTMKSYDKTTDSEEMHRFVDTCIHYIDTYGEYEATNYIAKQYREIPQVGKLMRLIRQANEGGDVRAELIGFRNELLEAKKYTLQKHKEKLVMKAQLSFNILIPILIQAIISATAIYLPDIMGAASVF